MSFSTIAHIISRNFRFNTSLWFRSNLRICSLLIYFLFSIFYLATCGLDVEDPTPPSPPVWVQKSLPEEWPERGIDAHESGGIYLEWESNQEEDIVAYNIYRATWYNNNDSLGNYEMVSRIDLESMSTFEFIDSQVVSRVRYYYKIKAEDASGSESKYSDSISYTLLNSISEATMFPNGRDVKLPIDRKLWWGFDRSIEMENYCITFLTEDDILVARETFLPSVYTGSNDYWQIPTEIIFSPNMRYTWRIDMGANYENSVETSGSESAWATFIFQEN